MHYLVRFLRRGPVSPRVHGTLDYLLAAALRSRPCSYVLIGAGGLGATLLTRFESDLMPAARLASRQAAV